MSDTHAGGCVCGAVRYRAHGEPARVTVCHCTWCQRRTGSAFGVASVFDAARVEITGQAPRTYRHRSDESGRWLDLHFCSSCGTNIGFTLEWVPGVFAVDSGTFDEPSWIDPGRHDFRYIYLRSAQGWSTLPGGADTYEKHFRD
jgi:hypothetical protein